MVSKAKKTHGHNVHILHPKLRNLGSCLSEHAVKVSDSSCSGSAAGGNSLTVLNPSLQNAITCVYWAKLSTAKKLLIRLTWSKSPAGPTLSVAIQEHELMLKKKKGDHSFLHGGTGSVISLNWDFSSAKFGSGPEPLANFYFVVKTGAEVALSIGDSRLEEDEVAIADFSMVSRKEQAVILGVYSTRARFREEGKEHDIAIKCRGDSRDAREAELTVWVDKKRVVHEQRLDWNFRGNQIVFVDGAPVDVLWDLYDWWFGGHSGGGCAVFLFRARCSLESRLWLEEDQDLPGFSLIVQAFKSS